MISTVLFVRDRVSKTKARIPVVWVRHRKLGLHDAFIASYPRSGSTWLRFLLFEALTGDSAEFESVNRAIPKVGKQRDAVHILPDTGRLIQTHEPYRREYKKAVYLVRDVRDVVLSEFARQKEMGVGSDQFDECLLHFLQGRVNAYGSWQIHVNSWLDALDDRAGDIVIVKFEDLRRKTEEVLAGILHFLGAALVPDVIRTAIINNTVERMRAKEDRSRVIHRATHEEGRFVRTGSIQGWRGRLTGAQQEIILKRAGHALTRLGYFTPV